MKLLRKLRGGHWIKYEDLGWIKLSKYSDKLDTVNRHKILKHEIYNNEISTNIKFFLLKGINNQYKTLYYNESVELDNLLNRGNKISLANNLYVVIYAHHNFSDNEIIYYVREGRID